MNLRTVQTGISQQLRICADLHRWGFGASRQVKSRRHVAGRPALSRHMLVGQDRSASQSKPHRHVQRLATFLHAERKPLNQRTGPVQPTGLSAIEGRQMLLAALPVESFKMVGVSFEGRQELVSALKPGKPECLLPKLVLRIM